MKCDQAAHLCLCAFSPDEREVVTVIAGRIDKARAQYGFLSIDDDTRDWEDEWQAEDIDSAIYKTIHTIKRKRRRKASQSAK